MTQPPSGPPPGPPPSRGGYGGPPPTDDMGYGRGPPPSEPRGPPLTGRDGGYGIPPPRSSYSGAGEWLYIVVGTHYITLSYLCLCMYMCSVCENVEFHMHLHDVHVG